MRNDENAALSDLRESGSIEQDADVVFLVHRPDFYDKEDRPGGPTIMRSTVTARPTRSIWRSLGAYSKFKDMRRTIMVWYGLELLCDAIDRPRPFARLRRTWWRQRVPGQDPRLSGTRWFACRSAWCWEVSGTNGERPRMVASVNR